MINCKICNKEIEKNTNKINARTNCICWQQLTLCSKDFLLWLDNSNQLY